MKLKKDLIKVFEKYPEIEKAKVIIVLFGFLKGTYIYKKSKSYENNVY